MGVGTMAWGDEKAGFVSDPKRRPKGGEFNPADIQVRPTVSMTPREDSRSSSRSRGGW